MSVRNLDRIFKATRVAVIGASNERTSVGYTVLRNLRDSGFSGEIYPVNPKHASIQGQKSYAHVGQLPNPPDLAVICTPATTVPKLVRECGEAGILGLVVLSGGFREIGEEGRQLERQLLHEASAFEGMRLLGPNCVGVVVPRLALNASFARDVPKAGHLSFVSQSGALGTAILDWAVEEDIGFSHFVSVGNMLDVDFGDLIDYLSMDSHTRAVLLYVEAISDARKFMSAARAFTLSRPIVAYKAGRFTESAQAATSHTGALAGEDAVYDAAFARSGIVRVGETRDVFDCAELLARHSGRFGERLSVVTNAGGPGVIAADALMESRGRLASLSDETRTKLEAALPPYWSRANPVDILGDASPERYERTLKILMDDPQVDALLVLLTPQAMTDPAGTADVLVRMAEGRRKPILSVFMGGRSVREALAKLNRAEIPTYGTPEEGVRAFTYLVSHARRRKLLYETPRDVSPHRSSDPGPIHEAIATQRLEDRCAMLDEPQSKALLEAYGIPVNQAHPAASPDEAVRIAERLGYPLVLKVHSPDITHKTDVNGVALNVKTPAEVRSSFDHVLSSAKKHRPEARLLGVTVQRMMTEPNAIEMILGSKTDTTFGAAIMLGMGGTAAELTRDRVLELPPLNEKLARHMLESLRSWPLIAGYRGEPGVDVEALIDVLNRFSYLVADFPEIQEIDVNPLLVARDRVVALDARVILKPGVDGAEVKPFAHLAIRPFPEEFVARRALSDGTVLTFRPIRPEDEPRWSELIDSCSPASIFRRFQHMFKRTHETAVRFCFTDYDRELAIVAEPAGQEPAQLIAVGRLVADPDHESAEYAVLVTDAWQGRGVGTLLTEYCLDVAKRWGLKRVTAFTTPTNTPMARIFRSSGFELDLDREQDLLCVSKPLGV